MVSKINKKAFTLIEAIIVTGLIFILIAGIVIIINPQEYLMKARDDQREMHLNALNQVIQQLARRQDWPCDPIPEEITLIGSAIDQYDLYSCPDFLVQPVYDPRVGYFNNVGDYFTGYEIKQNSTTKRISLYAQESELRLVYLGEKLGIYTWVDLNDIRNDLSGNHTLMANLDKNSIGYDEIAGPLANDGQGWEPIGISWLESFNGNFNGNGYTISDLYINRPSQSNIGLFGYVRGASTNDRVEIKKLKIENCNISGYNSIGGLVGYGTNLNISEVGITGTLETTYSYGYVGGLVGGWINNTNIENSYFHGNIIPDFCDNCMGSILTMIDSNVSLSYVYGISLNKNLIGGCMMIPLTGQFFGDKDIGLENNNCGGEGKTTIELKNILTYQETEEISSTLYYVDYKLFNGTETEWQLSHNNIDETKPFTILNASDGWVIVSSEDYEVNYPEGIVTFYQPPENGKGYYTQEYSIVNIYPPWDIAEIQDHSDEIWYIDNNNDYPKLWFEK